MGALQQQPKPQLVPGRVMCALAKDPAQRFESAAAFADALRKA